MVELSTQISHDINKVTDLLLDYFSQRKDHLLEDDLFKNILLRYCPPVLQQKFGSYITRLPSSHVVAILAASIGSKIIYNEGLAWLETVGEKQKLQAIMTYIRHDRFTEKLISSVHMSNLTSKDEIVKILKSSAARDLTMFDLDNKTSS